MKYGFFIPFFAILLLSSCMAPLIRVDESAEAEYAQRDEIVKGARSLLGQKDLTALSAYYRNDCSGYVLGVYRSLGYQIELRPASRTERITELLYRSLKSEGLTYVNARPKKADVVFFKGKGPRYGGIHRISHVGLVEDVLNDGTVLLLHYSSKGVSELMMNLHYPHSPKNDDGAVINDFLRKRPAGAGNYKLLSGELFFSYGNLYQYAEK